MFELGLLLKKCGQLCCFGGAVHGEVENAVLVPCATFVEEKLLGGCRSGWGC